MIQQIDFRILDWIQLHCRTEWLDWLMPRITLLGDKGWLWIALALFFLLRRPTRRWGLAMLVGLLGSLLVGNVLIKHLVARDRPCWLNPEVQLLIAVPLDYSFPSGHTLASFISATVLLRFHRGMGLAALAAAVCIALSRLYLYVHFPTDVLGGVLIGIAVGIGAVVLCERVLFPRLQRHL